jgi:hypothetical protein
VAHTLGDAPQIVPASEPIREEQPIAPALMVTLRGGIVSSTRQEPDARLSLGGTGTVTGSTYQPTPQLVPFYQKMFGLYRSAAGTPLAILSCPFNSDGSRADGGPPNGNACRSASGASAIVLRSHAS